MSRALVAIPILLLAGCASSIELPFDTERFQTGFGEAGPITEPVRSFERGFLGGTLLERGLFLGGLPFEALEFANEMESRIAHEGFDERQRILEDPDGGLEAERIKIDRKLQHPDPVIRMDALAKVRLSASGPRDHYYRILALLDDPHPQVRVMAMNALAGYWEHSSFPRLAERLHDPDSHNRKAAAEHVTQFDADLAVPTLYQAFAREEMAFVRIALVESLAAFPGDPRTVPILVQVLEDESAIVRDEANRSLREITGQDFEFDPYGEEPARRSAIDRWREWSRTRPDR